MCNMFGSTIEMVTNTIAFSVQCSEDIIFYLVNKQDEKLSESLYHTFGKL